MPIRIFAAAIVVVVVAASSVRAESLIQTLPEDGAWVTFQGNVDANGEKMSPTWTVRSVGKKDVAGVACRWIELQAKQDDKNQVLFKGLIPESEFGKGKHPLDHTQQLFMKRDDEQPIAVTSLKDADPILAQLLQGPGANAKNLDQKEAIETQTGKLECDVIVGTHQSEIGTLKVKLSHRLLISDKVPFGLAAAKMDISFTVNGQENTVKAEIMLKESGKDAKSALPDIQ